MNTIRLLSCLIVGFAITACSNQWREGGGEITSQEVASIIAEIEQSQAMAGAGSGNLSEALALKDDPNASVYYADAYSRSKGDTRRAPVGAVANVLGFFNFEFLNLPDVGYKNISEARVLFFDAPQPDRSRKSSLVIGIKNGSDVFNYYAFVGYGDIADDSYEAYLESGAGLNPIIVKSFDVDGGLDTVIQLKVYDTAGYYLGKIATLVGFKY